jgi:hypothetical protein
MASKELSRFNEWKKCPIPYRAVRTAQSAMGKATTHVAMADSCGASGCNCGGSCNGECNSK